MIRVFDNGPGDLGSILGQVISKALKRYLIPPFLKPSIIKNGSRISEAIKGKK